MHTKLDSDREVPVTYFVILGSNYLPSFSIYELTTTYYLYTELFTAEYIHSKNIITSFDGLIL